MRKLVFLLFFTPLCAYVGPVRLDILCGPDRISIGPEVYYINKEQDREFQDKHHRINQEGWMYGERISYDRLRCNALYYGADQYYAVGCVGACNKFGKHPKMQLKDAEVEGRLGYTFGTCWPCRAFFTPIVGYGNYNGQERFKRRPLFKKKLYKKHEENLICVNVRPRFNFVSTGFLSGVFLNDCSSIGVNFKAKFMTSGKNKVERTRKEIEWDHENECTCKKKKKFRSFCQKMGNRTQYQVDIPMTYYAYCQREQEFEMSVIPFYRLRRYGARENFPINFPETSFQMVGVRFMLTYLF